MRTCVHRDKGPAIAPPLRLGPSPGATAGCAGFGAGKRRAATCTAVQHMQLKCQFVTSSRLSRVQDFSQRQRVAARLRCHRRLVVCSLGGKSNSGDGVPPAQQQHKATQLERFAGFLAAGDAKEAWLCISASVLRLAIPSAVLATALHSSLWGGTPPAVVAVAEVAAWGGTIIAGGTEVWKILEGFRG